MKLFLSIFILLTSLTTYSQYTKFEDAKQFKFLTISGQPNKSTIDKIKDQKFDMIIDIRNPGEHTEFNEGDYAKEKGIAYYNVPFFDKDKKISKKNIENITKLVQKNQDKKVFIHCSSGNRVSGWLLVHLTQDHGMEMSKALEVTTKTGLTKEDFKNKVIKFIKEKY